MLRSRAGAALAALVLVPATACRRPPFQGPVPLLSQRTAAGTAPRVATLDLGGETRAALVEPASFAVDLPARPLLTFGIGLTWTGAGEAPGWYRLTVRAGDRVLAERTVNPRALREWRDVSVPVEGAGRRTTIAFDLRLTDRDGQPLPIPPGLVLGVGEPVLHDLDAYGRARGVVLVSIDTVRRDHVGAYGYARPTTPRFDALARDGILFDDAVSTSSWTLPAHLSMLTGVDPGRHGGVDSRHGFNRAVPTVPALLRTAGFATRAVTSHLYVSGVYGLDDGFEHLDFRQDRKATEVADRGIALLDRFGDRPFFVFLHLYDPHWHYDPPDWARRLFETSYAGKVTGVWQDFSRRDRKDVSAADLAHLLALYDGEIRYADTEVGRVLDHLAARGLDRSTLVVITSDHGEEFLDHGSWEHQKTLYEEVVRVPLAIRGPGVAPRRERAQASLLDVAPTILAWAGVPVPAAVAGRSLLARGGVVAIARPTARPTRPSTPPTSSSCAAAPRAGRRSSRCPRTGRRRAGRNGTISPPIQPSARASLPRPRSPIRYGGGRWSDGARVAARGSGTSGVPQPRAAGTAARARIREWRHQ